LTSASGEQLSQCQHCPTHGWEKSCACAVPYVARQRSYVADMICQALQLQRYGTQCVRSRRRIYTQQLLYCNGMRQCIADCGIRAGGFSQVTGLLPWKLCKSLLYSAVLISKSNIQICDNLTGATEPEMSGLYDPCVYRPDRDLVNPFACYL
jgi:hypothetical protein